MHPSSCHFLENAQANMLMMTGAGERDSSKYNHPQLLFLQISAEGEMPRWSLFVEPVNFLISLHKTPIIVKARMCVTQMSLSFWWYQPVLGERQTERQREAERERNEDDINDKKTALAVIIMMMMILFSVSTNMTLHFDVVYVCGWCLTVCASFYTHICTLEDLKLDCLFW